MRRNRTVYVRAFSAFIAAVLFTSCQEESITVQQHAHTVGFYAGGGQTRTTMLSDGLSTVWSAGDELSLWARNSSGAYTISNHKFVTYGIDNELGFFTSDKNEVFPQMPNGDYTYICCYPRPVAVSGTDVTFDLPAVQDGKASSGVDIMISDQVPHGPLTQIPDPEDHSGMSMRMKHMMHQFRFFIPGDNTVIGQEKLERIRLTFPSGVAGKVTYDIENPDAAPSLSDPKSAVELRLSEPLGISNPDMQYACFAFVPQKFTSGQKMAVKAYTADKIAYFDDIDLCERDFKAGRSTPVKLNVSEIADYPYKISFKVALNNLGENPTKIILTAPSGCRWNDEGSNVYTYEPGREIAVREVFTVRFEDEDQYRAFSEKDISVTYDSENTITYQTVRMPDLLSINSTELQLTVPYLFFQNFSGIPSFSDGHDNPKVGGSSDESYKNIVGLSSYTQLLDGWFGTRIGGQASTAIRICCRYENAVWTSAYYKGRVYTPFLTGIKPDKSVKISVSFKYGGDRNERDPLLGDPPKKSPILHFGINSQETITNPDMVEGDVMDSITGLIAGTGFRSPNVTSLNPKVINGESLAVGYGYTSFAGTKTVTIDNVDCDSRLGWVLSTDNTADNTNGNYWLYLDDIKVQIVK